MRKIFISLFALLLTAGIANATLYNYFQEQGQELPSVSDRLTMAQNCGISNYTGKADENIFLEECLRSEAVFGVTIPDISALFQTSLQGSIASNATSMTLVSATLPNGNSLSGTYGFIIDEGSSNEEFVICSASGTTLTSCTRGIDPVDGQTEVVSLQKSHRRGASVKITDFPILGVMRKILTGDYTLPAVLQYASSTSIGSFSNGNILATKGYVDIVGAGGFTSLNIGDGNTLRVNGTSPETVDIATSTDNWWFNINTDGYFALSTTTNKGLDTFWKDSYNATTTKGGNFTFSNNLIVGGNATTTGNQIISGNATTTGSMDVGNLCFGGTNCITSANMNTSTSTDQTITSTQTCSNETLWSYTVPANSIGSKGRISFKGRIASSNGNADLYIKIGGSTVCTYSLISNPTWLIECDFSNKTYNTQQGVLSKAFTTTAVVNASIPADTSIDTSQSTTISVVGNCASNAYAILNDGSLLISQAN